MLWAAWGLKTNAYALIILQTGLMVMNIKGAIENRRRSRN